MEVKPVILTGNRVELVPLEAIHAEGLYEAGNYPEIWAVTQGRIASLEDARAYVRKALDQTDAVPFVVKDRHTGKLLGSTRFFDISSVNRNGYVRDSVYYSIIDKEWPTVRARLEQYMNR